MKKLFIATLLAISATSAFAQQMPTPTGYPQSDVSGPPSPTILTSDDVSGPPLTSAQAPEGNDVVLGSFGAGLVGLIGLGKLAQRRKAAKK